MAVLAGLWRPYDEEDKEYEIFSTLSSARAWTRVILAGKRDSRRQEFWQEYRRGRNKLSNVRNSIILGSREGLTLFNNYNSASFSSGKTHTEAFRGV